MAAHAYLKNEFTEDKKCQNLMSWLICRGDVSLAVSDAEVFIEMKKRYDKESLEVKDYDEEWCKVKR